MRRYEIAVIRRAITRVQRVTGKRRVIVTADRGFADVALVDVLTALGVEFILRVKGTTKVCWHDQWRKLPPCPLWGTPAAVTSVASRIVKVPRIGCG